MTLAQLKAVSEVMATGSISSAAKKLYLTQPAVTKQIRVLEEELQVTLFERSGKGVVPTASAHELLPRIEKLIRGMEGLKHTLSSGDAHEIRGVACISAGAVFSQTILPSVIATCRERHPRVQVFVFEAAIRQQLQQMRQGEFRIALGSDFARSSDLDFTPLLKDELVLIAPLNHPLAKGKGRLPLAEVARQQAWVTHYYAGGMETALRRAGLPRRLFLNDNPVVARTTNTSTIIAFVAGGLGISVVPRYVVKMLKRTDLAMREIDPPMPIEYGYYQMRGGTLNPAESAFLDVLRETILCWKEAGSLRDRG